MGEVETILLLCVEIIFIAILFYVINKRADKLNTSGNSSHEYSGGYDGGHNNYDSSNITQLDDHITKD
jgi:hypothetical protein